MKQRVGRTGGIIADLKVDLPRPRIKKGPAFITGLIKFILS
jgi:hypothetical protein